MLILRFQSNGYCQESQEELKASALKLFENEKYVEATPLYLRLLAIDPRSYDYNYHYGACLLFNSYKKQDAFKYLNYSVSGPGIDIQAYYFLGKAYHLNYQFNEAIRNYELYKQKAGSKVKPALELDRQIEMCQNGKRLLTTITDLIVLEKKEIPIADFFRLYNLNNIGGDIIVAADYQSKVDKKKGHVPLIHFPAGATAIYYASYGETDKGQKDIYTRKRLPDGSWGSPELVPGNVNTPYDEDFPYMHPGGEYLYFCSKGHNSMGGYDIFRSSLNPENRTFGPPENMDFAISSPDNDLFYVVDSLDNNAYFASSRQSSNGKMFVYKVRVDRVPLQLAAIKGTFSSTINPDNKKLTITVTDVASGNKIGTFYTNENGVYLITLPKGGKYSYEMKVEGKPGIHKYSVSVPFSKEFRPLKQQILEETVDNSDIVHVVDLFNEPVEDPVGILAEIIKQRSELNPNADQFDLKQIDAGKENEKILAELGFANAGPQEIALEFDQLSSKQQERVTGTENLVNGALTSALEKLENASELQEKAKTLVNKANSVAASEEKFKFFTEAQAAMDEATALKKDAKILLAFADSVAQTLPKEQELLTAIQTVASEVKTAVADNNASNLKEIISKNTTTITAVSEVKATNPVDALIEEKTQLRKDQAVIQSQKDNYTKTAQTLEKEISNLEASLPTAKKKDQAGIQSSIDSKKQELALVNEENERLTQKLATQAAKEDAVDDRIEFLQGIAQTTASKKVAPNQVETRLAEVDTRNSNTLASYINQQVTELKKDTSLLVSTDPVSTVALEDDHEAELRDISSRPNLTVKERAELLIAAEETFVQELDDKIARIDAALQRNPSDQKAIADKKELDAIRSKRVGRITAIRQSEETQPETYTVETVLKTLVPDYEDRLTAVEGDRKTVLENENIIDKEVVIAVDSELEEVESQLIRNPNNEEAQEHKAALNDLKEQATARIAGRDEELASLNTAENPSESKIATVAARVRPEYVNNKKAIENKIEPGIEQELALLKEERALLQAINKAVEKTEEQVLKNPENTVLQDQLEELRTAQSVQEALINEWELDLTAAAASEINAQRLQSEIAPSYLEVYPENMADLSEAENNKRVADEKKLQTTLSKRQTDNQRQLQKAFDPQLAAENKVITSLIEASEMRVQQLTTPTVTSPEVMALLENDLGDAADMLLYSDPTTVEQAKQIITELNDYKNELTDQLKMLKAEDDPVNEAEIAQKESQLAFVRKRIGSVETDLDAMENFTVPATVDATEEQKFVRLSNEEKQLKERLNSEKLSSKERKSTEKELKSVQAEKAVSEQLIVKDKLTDVHKAVAEAQSRLTSESGRTDLSDVVSERSTVAPIIGKPEPTVTDLKTQLQKEEQAYTLLQAIDGFVATENTFTTAGVVVESIPELTNRKRRFSIEIGQLEAEIATLSDPVKVTALKRQQSVLKAAVDRIDAMIAVIEKEHTAENPLKAGLETTVTYEEELAIARTPEYVQLVKENEAVKSTQRQLNELNREKESIRKAIKTATSDEKRQSLITALINLDAEAKTVSAELLRQQTSLEKSIAGMKEDPEKVRNLLARDVSPMAAVSRVESVPAALKNGFELIVNPTAVRQDRILPVDLKMPTGLVYRVQVGAFARPIPEDLFKEFTPVTGEKLTNGITRYLAGYFGNRQRVLEAQKDIRALGYSDAFVVAYCDGERITLAEARRLEDAGLCVPKNQDSLMMEVVENTLSKLSPDSLARLRPIIKKSDYNKAPGAVLAEAIEDRQGLFFTVQVGVYNRPATSEQLRNIDPLITKRLDNGQIRYSSGIFQSVTAAKPKRSEAITRGISDAFITAYYKGERISLTEAQRLLEEQGESILEKEQITVVSPVALQEAQEYNSTQPIKSTEKYPVQLISAQTYETYPSEQLSSFNMYGSFYYDVTDRHIKSIVYGSVDALPQVKFLQESVDTVFQKTEIGSNFELKPPPVVAVWDNPVMDGAFADWLLRLTIPHSGMVEENGFRLTFEGVEPETSEMLLQQLRSYGAVSVKQDTQ